MRRIKVLVCGCSITFGYGLKNNINNEKLWVNQLIRIIYPEAIITNLAKIWDLRMS